MSLSFILGWSITSNQKGKELEKIRKQYEQQLRNDNKKHTQQIDSLNLQINDLAKEYLTVSQQLHNIKEQQNNIIAQTQKKREEAKHFTKDEKYNFLISRYSDSTINRK